MQFKLPLILIFLFINQQVSSTSSKEFILQSNEFVNSVQNAIMRRATSKNEEDDHPCEQVTGKMIAYLLNQTEITPEIEDFYKFALYSGTAIGDWGDYFGCKKMNNSNYHMVNYLIQNATNGNDLSLQVGLCYFKECDTEYFNKVKIDIANYLNKTEEVDIKPDNLIFVDSEEENEKLRKNNVVGFSIVMAIIGLLVILNLFYCILKSQKNKKASIIYNVDEERKSVKNFLENDHTKYEPQNSKCEKIMQYFDFNGNLVKIFSVKNTNKTYEALRIFDGVRFLSTGWVVFGHTFFIALFAGFKNAFDIFEFAKTFKACFLLAAPYSVDVFFYMSGFLLYFALQKVFNKKINKFKMFGLALFNRYTRLFSFYLFCVIGIPFMMPYLGSGPYYYNASMLSKSCYKNFWENLLYINNLIHYSNKGDDMQCGGHTWYLANDMQFFIVSIFLFFFLNNLKWVRNSIFAGLFVASNAFQIYENYHMEYNYNLDLNHRSPNSGKFFDNYYTKPWNRICPYLLGIFFCELFLETPVYIGDYKKVETKSVDENADTDVEERVSPDGNVYIRPASKVVDQNVPILRKFNLFLIQNSIATYIIFILSLILINGAFIISMIANRYDYSQFWGAMFNTFSKTLFVFGLGCIIHLTFLGKFTFIKDLLSIKFFTIFSRITFGIYIIHIYLITVYFFSFNSQTYMKMGDYTFLAIGFFFVTAGLSLFFTVILESPIVQFLKSLTGKGQEA